MLPSEIRKQMLAIATTLDESPFADKFLPGMLEQLVFDACRLQRIADYQAFGSGDCHESMESSPLICSVAHP